MGLHEDIARAEQDEFDRHTRAVAPAEPDQADDWPYDASAPELVTAASAIYTQLKEGTPGTGGQG